MRVRAAQRRVQRAEILGNLRVQMSAIRRSRHHVRGRTERPSLGRGLLDGVQSRRRAALIFVGPFFDLVIFESPRLVRSSKTHLRPSREHGHSVEDRWSARTRIALYEELGFAQRPQLKILSQIRFEHWRIVTQSIADPSRRSRAEEAKPRVRPGQRLDPSASKAQLLSRNREGVSDGGEFDFILCPAQIPTLSLVAHRLGPVRVVHDAGDLPVDLDKSFGRHLELTRGHQQQLEFRHLLDLQSTVQEPSRRFIAEGDR